MIEFTEKGLIQLAKAIAEELKKETVKNVQNFKLIDSRKMIDGYKVIEGQGAHAHLINEQKHAVFHEIGTGIYGPEGVRIKPKSKKFMAWQIRAKDTGKYKGKKEGDWIFAKSTRGVPASAPVRKAIMKMHFG